MVIYEKNDKGMALITAIMLLVILTVIGLASVSTMQTERDIASGETAYRIGFYKADSGISFAAVSIEESDIKDMKCPAEYPVSDKPFRIRIIRKWQQQPANIWRVVAESTSVPGKYAGTVTVQAEFQLSQTVVGRELDVGNLTSY